MGVILDRRVESILSKLFVIAFRTSNGQVHRTGEYCYVIDDRELMVHQTTALVVDDRYTGGEKLLGRGHGPDGRYPSQLGCARPGLLL